MSDLLSDMKVWLARRVRDGEQVYYTPTNMVHNGVECDPIQEAAAHALVRDGSHGWITLAGGWMRLEEVTAA